MNNPSSKFYYSPLSIGAILLIGWGIWILIRMLKGAYPTYFVFILPIVGFGLLVLDYFIRKSNLDTTKKIFIQTVSLILILGIGYFLFQR